MQGHGKALILALAEAAKCNKMDQLQVHIGSNDNGMASFYRKLGFTPLRTFKTLDTMWMDEYILAIPGKWESQLISLAGGFVMCARGLRSFLHWP